MGHDRRCCISYFSTGFGVFGHLPSHPCVSHVDDIDVFPGQGMRSNFEGGGLVPGGIKATATRSIHLPYDNFDKPTLQYVTYTQQQQKHLKPCYKAQPLGPQAR
jgi:hypothetical protein